MRWVGPCWLSQEAVGRLAAVTHELWENRMGGWAVINGQSVVEYTAKMFVYKALPFKFRCRIAKVESGTVQVSWTNNARPSNPLRMSVWPVASHTRTPAGVGIIAATPRSRAPTPPR